MTDPGLQEPKAEAVGSIRSNGYAALRHARRLVVLVIGGTVCAMGVAMLVLPGPGFLGILFGVSILASEFAWARSLLKRAKRAVGLEDPKPGAGT